MITVLIADDHPVVREGMRRTLEPEDDIRVVAEARDGRETVTLCREHGPDVAIVDFAMPALDGLGVTRRLRRQCPRTRVLIFTMYDSEEYAMRLLRSGAFGFIAKGTSGNELAPAIRKVHEGGKYISQSVLERIGSHVAALADSGPLSQLSDRELQVLKALAEGKKAREIAEDLNLSLSTVHGYRYRLMKKLGLESNSALVRFALEKGLIK